MEVHQVENLACDAGGQLPLREALVLNKLLDTGYMFGDFVPLEVDDLAEFLQGVDLLLYDAAVEHGNELG